MKRGREQILLLVTTTEDCAYYCYTASLASFTREQLETLHQSQPSQREGKVLGCLSTYDSEEMYDKSVWTYVDDQEIPYLENVGKVVLAYAYE